MTAEKIEKWVTGHISPGHHTMPFYEGIIRNELTGQQFSIEELDDAIAICIALNDGLKLWARITELEAALKPFAELATEIRNDWGDMPGESLVIYERNEKQLTVADFKHAAAVLGEAPKTT